MTSALDKLNKRAGAGAPKGPEVHIPLNKIRFDPKQPRKAFHHLDGKVSEKDQAYIEELAATIKVHGQIESITLEEMGDGTYRVVVGECRTRAHLLLGLPSIRAVIRNDLGNPAKRLAYQLVENVTREDLSDADLAESIAVLMKGFEGEPPLKQVEIAVMLGKSEGWVTRYVKFGDDELQRLWVESGIAVTPENLYRLSILPSNAQVDIRRRVDLPQDHDDFLAKPVDRNVIDQYARDAKIAKAVAAQRQTLPPAAPQLGAQHAAGRADNGVAAQNSNGVAAGDTTGQTLANLAAEGQQGRQTEGPASGVTASAAQTKYTLPADVRSAILSNKTGGTGGAAPDAGNGAVALPPVNCRASLSNLRALFALLDQNDQAEIVDDVPCNLNFSGTAAQDLANLLTGVVVDSKEVPAVLQSELARLQLQQA